VRMRGTGNEWMMPSPSVTTEGKAKEDARYVLALATKTQLGMTINARSLEKLLRRLDKIDLNEARNLKSSLEKAVKTIAPSLIRYTKSDDFEKNSALHIPDLPKMSFSEKIELLEHSPNSEENIISAVIFEKFGYDAVQIRNWAKKLSASEKKKIFADIFQNMKSFHSVPRAFETASFTFQIPMSASCFAQLKRHRMSTILNSDYQPEAGFVIPPLLKQLGFPNEMRDIIRRSNEFYQKLETHRAGLGNYILTNAHKLFVIFKDLGAILIFGHFSSNYLQVASIIALSIVLSTNAARSSTMEILMSNQELIWNLSDVDGQIQWLKPTWDSGKIGIFLRPGRNMGLRLNLYIVILING